ncbi:DNA-binding protein [Rhizorhabdus dicambivorans]|uniref:DNA-binding protein n=1 Tax=Rhizorhabdus dicambivorans TaxID=1850238 RepID=A0A2A4FTW9_9SPHN|nr:helix-turn-helix domain-containing protein [Rhizorhabdus dicambivorans]ATE65770.1 DNA-binding protein [Rhizorhabdus dicambivorans]PCE41146.1 DNA-binding protein [Rhizorhabdus dicambivorans]
MRDIAPTAAASSPFLSNDEAASFLRLSPRTLEKFRVTGGGPKFRKFRRRVLYALTDLRDWADRRISD